MAKADDLDARAERLRLLMVEKYRMRARTLEKALKRAGRRLPRRNRRQVRALIDACKLSSNPRLAVQVDRPAILRGIREVERHLATIDPAAALRERMLDMAALVAFYILVVLVAVVLVLWWRGYV
ncbi:MAG: hypothetical protein P1U53_02520 [Sulfitobacter sp.]|nr:hypothetical protein [Sulfitobacter sp.]